jgi:prephenate dehydrogenase
MCHSLGNDNDTGEMGNQTVVTVVGLGLIGGSLCHAFKRARILVKGVSGGRTIEKAMSLQIIDEGFEYANMHDALHKSEFVFLCTPLQDIVSRLPEVFECCDRNTVISDVGSTKSVICRTAEKYLPRGAYFIGGHPMAGSEKRGIENANPYLFYDAVYVLTPLTNTPKKAIKRLSALLSLVGAKIMVLEPGLHDMIAASVSHLPQLLAVLLTNHLADKNSDLYRNLAAGGFRDMTRIASSSYDVWKDIISTNIQQIGAAMNDFQKRLSHLGSILEDEHALKEVFEEARRERQTIPRYSKGFLKPLFDVRVSVKDRAGELARITNIIYYHDINIKDIEIVNIREGEGGILRLGFSIQKDAQKAAEALEEVGYEVVVVD